MAVTLPAAQIVYQRRQPELTALHRVVAARWESVRQLCRDRHEGHPLPQFVVRAFERYLGCGRLSRGLVRVHCKTCKTDQLVALSCKVRGLCASCDGRRMTETAAHLVDEVIPKVPVRQWVLTLPYDLRYLVAWNTELRSAVLGALMRAVEAHYVAQAKARGVAAPKTGAISVLQRFDSSLRLDVHWHVLFADGTWSEAPDGTVAFTPAPTLSTVDVQQVLYDAWLRIGRQLDRYADQDVDTLREREPALAGLLQAAVAGRQVTGEEAGRKVRQERGGKVTVPRPHGRNCAEFDGFSLHANTRVGEAAREQLERLCRYLCRPAISAGRVEYLDDGRVRIRLKQAWRDGTEAVTLPVDDLVLRLAAQIPLPKKPSLRYHGVFAPNANLRSKVVPAGASPKCGRHKSCAPGPDAEAERQTSTRMTWAEAFKRAFRLDLLDCPCGGRRVVLAAVLDAHSLERILRHVRLWPDSADIDAIRGPPDDVWPADDVAGADWDACDDLPPLDFAA